MDFDEAVRAHVLWRMKLVDYLNNPDGSLNSQDIQVDNKCELGKWLYSEASKWNFLPEYSNLLFEHARFHEEASKVVEKAHSGQDVSDVTAIGGESAFSVASAKVIDAIMHFQNRGLFKKAGKRNHTGVKLP